MLPKNCREMLRVSAKLTRKKSFFTAYHCFTLMPLIHSITVNHCTLSSSFSTEQSVFKPWDADTGNLWVSVLDGSIPTWKCKRWSRCHETAVPSRSMFGAAWLLRIFAAYSKVAKNPKKNLKKHLHLQDRLCCQLIACFWFTGRLVIKLFLFVAWLLPMTWVPPSIGRQPPGPLHHDPQCQRPQNGPSDPHGRRSAGNLLARNPRGRGRTVPFPIAKLSQFAPKSQVNWQASAAGKQQVRAILAVEVRCWQAGPPEFDANLQKLGQKSRGRPVDESVIKKSKTVRPKDPKCQFQFGSHRTEAQYGFKPRSIWLNNICLFHAHPCSVVILASHTAWDLGDGSPNFSLVLQGQDIVAILSNANGTRATWQGKAPVSQKAGKLIDVHLSDYRPGEGHGKIIYDTGWPVISSNILQPRCCI